MRSSITVETSNNSLDRLDQTVLRGNYCIGCGVCAAVAHDALFIEFDQWGMLKAHRISQNTASNLNLSAICPFGEDSLSEDQIGSRFFDTETSKYDLYTGFYLGSYVGHVIESGYRANGSSGGMTSWILKELLERHLVDCVLHVQQTTSDNESTRLFAYSLSYTVQQVKNGAKSRYYPIEMSKVLRHVENNPGRYAVVGLPCFIKAIRLWALSRPQFLNRICFTVGLVCGHLKSKHFASSLAWQSGIHPDNLGMIDFRYKIEGRPANKYGIRLEGDLDGELITVVKPNVDFLGYKWEHSFFKYTACSYCDDVLAETADITLGDAWLPKYIEDSKGSNIVITRNRQVEKIIQEGIESGNLMLNPLSVTQIIESQAAGFRDRREGLAYRLYWKQRLRQWHPPKRVQSSYKHLPLRRKLVYIMREVLSAQSHRIFAKAYRENDLTVFIRTMQRWTCVYDIIKSSSIKGVTKRLWMLFGTKKSL